MEQGATNEENSSSRPTVECAECSDTGMRYVYGGYSWVGSVHEPCTCPAGTKIVEEMYAAYNDDNSFPIVNVFGPVCKPDGTPTFC
jgi:hypothetical protein